jgi:cell division protein ZapA (FtsZ GTPase activity inhibitor)
LDFHIQRHDKEKLLFLSAFETLHEAVQLKSEIQGQENMSFFQRLTPRQRTLGAIGGVIIGGSFAKVIPTNCLA